MELGIQERASSNSETKSQFSIAYCLVLYLDMVDSRSMMDFDTIKV